MAKAEVKTPETPETAPAGFVPKIAKKITLPLIKPAIDKPVYIKFTAPLFIGKQIGEKDAAVLGNCVDLETGEECQIIVPAVLQGILRDEFAAAHFGKKLTGDAKKDKGLPVIELEPAPEDGDKYVGQGFALTKHAKASGKNYHPFSVSLLDLS